MSVLNAVLLGIVQGFTEFLPVSSSGHLVLIQTILPGFSEPPLVLDVGLHLGTLISVVFYFWSDWVGIFNGLILNRPAPDLVSGRREAWVLLTAVTVATLPAAVIGLLAEETIEGFFENPVYTSFFLIGTGIILAGGEWIHGGVQGKGIASISSSSWLHWVLIGLAQSFAMLPGISRSGSTISTAMACGWSRTSAARFSFYLMIPAVSGAVVLKVPEAVALIQSGSIGWFPLLIGISVSTVSGFLAIRFLMIFLKTKRLTGFSYYCIGAGLIAILLQLFLFR